jgi:hypothetical protein
VAFRGSVNRCHLPAAVSKLSRFTVAVALPELFFCASLLCRENRAKVHVPSKEDSAKLLLVPLGVAALWAFNYLAFVQ